MSRQGWQLGKGRCRTGLVDSWGSCEPTKCGNTSASKLLKHKACTQSMRITYYTSVRHARLSEHLSVPHLSVSICSLPSAWLAAWCFHKQHILSLNVSDYPDHHRLLAVIPFLALAVPPARKQQLFLQAQWLQHAAPIKRVSLATRSCSVHGQAQQQWQAHQPCQL